jgi:hypothetical protein
LNTDSCPVVAKVEMMGTPTIASMTLDGILCTQCLAMSDNKDYQLRLAQGTRLSSSEGVIPTYINMHMSENAVAPPEGQLLLSPVADIKAYRNTKSTTALHATFDPPAEVALRYDPSKLPGDASAAYVAYYDTTNGWTALPATGGPPEVSVVRARLDRPAPVAVLTRAVTAASQAKPGLELSKLTVSPEAATLNQQITISAVATNTSTSTTDYVVELTVDGKIVSSQRLTLAPQKSKAVTFTVNGDRPGTHQVSVGNLTGKFEVLATAEWSTPWWVWLIIGIVLLFLLWRFRKIIIRPSKRSSDDY